MRRWVLAVLTGVVAALAAATPAHAHSAPATGATDYRVTVTGLTAQFPGLTVRTVEAGARLELINQSAHPVEVLGYAGEPYLRVGPDGVYQNQASPATYLNDGLAPPSGTGAAEPPIWQRLSTTPAVLWHDHRTQGTAAWSVPLRDGVRDFAVTGTSAWVPRPKPTVWWAGCLVLGAAIGALGLRRTGSLRPVAVVAVVAGGAALAYAFGAAADLGALGFAGYLRGLFAHQPWALLCGAAALAGGGYALFARPAAELALALAGACVALFAGLTNAAVFGHGVAPVPYPGEAARTLVLLAIAGGAGVTAAAVLRLRAARTAPVPSLASVGA
jgi:hypothetical protein